MYDMYLNLYVTFVNLLMERATKCEFIPWGSYSVIGKLTDQQLPRSRAEC